MEQLSPKKNEYSVILSFKHDRQNKFQTGGAILLPVEFSGFQGDFRRLKKKPGVSFTGDRLLHCEHGG